jgi:hypothetical protein
MPTQSSTYNSRVTDEALEKRFRDTFRAQGGAELVDDLYAQGVIVPVVDFTAAATGTTLATNLQTAWDFSTGSASASGSTTTAISTAGFWKVWGHSNALNISNDARSFSINISDGLTTKTLWSNSTSNTSTFWQDFEQIPEFVVFLRSGDSLTIVSGSADNKIFVAYRQIATVSGDLVNPSGFTSS